MSNAKLQPGNITPHSEAFNCWLKWQA